MHFFAYKLSDNPAEEIVVGTTRLETLFGDVAVAVHPEDSRYSKYIGKSVIHPFNGRKLVVIGDSILVDPSVGTGAVKVKKRKIFLKKNEHKFYTTNNI